MNNKDIFQTWIWRLERQRFFNDQKEEWQFKKVHEQILNKKQWNHWILEIWNDWRSKQAQPNRYYDTFNNSQKFWEDSLRQAYFDYTKNVRDSWWARSWDWFFNFTQNFYNNLNQQNQQTEKLQSQLTQRISTDKQFWSFVNENFWSGYINDKSLSAFERMQRTQYINQAYEYTKNWWKLFRWDFASVWITQDQFRAAADKKMKELWINWYSEWQSLTRFERNWISQTIVDEINKQKSFQLTNQPNVWPWARTEQNYSPKPEQQKSFQLNNQPNVWPWAKTLLPEKNFSPAIQNQEPKEQSKNNQLNNTQNQDQIREDDVSVDNEKAFKQQNATQQLQNQYWSWNYLYLEEPYELELIDSTAFVWVLQSSLATIDAQTSAWLKTSEEALKSKMNILYHAWEDVRKREQYLTQANDFIRESWLEWIEERRKEIWEMQYNFLQQLEKNTDENIKNANRFQKAFENWVLTKLWVSNLDSTSYWFWIMNDLMAQRESNVMRLKNWLVYSKMDIFERSQKMFLDLDAHVLKVNETYMTSLQQISKDASDKLIDLQKQKIWSIDDYTREIQTLREDVTKSYLATRDNYFKNLNSAVSTNNSAINAVNEEYRRKTELEEKINNERKQMTLQQILENKKDLVEEWYDPETQATYNRTLEALERWWWRIPPHIQRVLNNTDTIDEMVLDPKKAIQAFWWFEILESMLYVNTIDSIANAWMIQFNQMAAWRWLASSIAWWAEAWDKFLKDIWDINIVAWLDAAPWSDIASQIEWVMERLKTYDTWDSLRIFWEWWLWLNWVMFAVTQQSYNAEKPWVISSLRNILWDPNNLIWQVAMLVQNEVYKRYQALRAAWVRFWAMTRAEWEAMKAAESLIKTTNNIEQFTEASIILLKWVTLMEQDMNNAQYLASSEFDEKTWSEFTLYQKKEMVSRYLGQNPDVRLKTKADFDSLFTELWAISQVWMEPLDLSPSRVLWDRDNERTINIMWAFWNTK